MRNIISAGAGSGKTTELCRIIADAVAKGLDPARILATTFTKKAAAELKSRALSKLIEAGVREKTERLELASIGTVHSVAHGLLTRYALDIGLSPRLTVLEQGVEKILANLMQADSDDRWITLTGFADRLAFEDLPGTIKQLMAVKRSNGITNDAFRQQMLLNAQRLCDLLEPSGNPRLPEENLYDLAQDALQAIENTTDTTKITAKAKVDLQKIATGRDSRWSVYLDAINLKAGATSDGHLDTIRFHAAEIRRHKGLHQDVRQFYDLLTEQTLLLEKNYSAYKSERGLVDFIDLEVMLLDVLANPKIRTKIASDFDLVLVDEFQDTNPIQLAIFHRLEEIVQENVWVGDLKQAIYGFRDTDPDLIRKAWEQVPKEQRKTLTHNYRSQRGLVQLFGKWFAPHFEDANQVPSSDSLSNGVERWVSLGKNQKTDLDALAKGILQLHQDGVSYREMSVLVRINRHIDECVKALEELGIPFQIESPGLFSTREGVLLLAGLRLVANRSDSLAAATLVHGLEDQSEKTPEWLAERLTSIRNQPLDPVTGKRQFQQPWEGDLRLAPLERIDHRSLAPSLVLLQVIEALGLASRVRRWGNSARRCANLDSALRHAREFEEASSIGRGSATLGGLILYLERLASDGADYCFVSPGYDAVSVLTYHSAKGLEWPVVILTHLGDAKDADLWKPVVDSQSDAANPLADRKLRAWFWPFGLTDSPFRRERRRGSQLEEDALQTAEGIAQQKRESEESKRLLYVGCTRAKKKLIFMHRHDKREWIDLIPQIGDSLDPSLAPGEHALTGIDTTYVVRHFLPEEKPATADQEAIQTLDEPSSMESWWIRESTGIGANDPSERFHAPSQVEGGDDCNVAMTLLEGSSFFPEGASEKDFALIGDAVHSYLAALPSLRGATSEQKTKVAQRCLTAFQATALIPTSVLVESGERLIRWVDTTYPGSEWVTEMPANAPRSKGGRWLGTMDLILELPSGGVVLIDHKSAPIRRQQCESKAREYSGQLQAYEEILQSDGRSVAARYIHFALAGALAEFLR